MENKIWGWLLIMHVWAAHHVCGQAGKPASDTGNPFTIEKITELGPQYKLIRPMVGTWQVQQRTWANAAAKPVVQPLFIVHRKLTGHFLEEIMEPMPGSDVKPFTRLTYLNFNNANLRWEYIVLDTRYPIMMFETSVMEEADPPGKLTLYLPAFVMPPGWDSSSDGKLAKQRRVISIENPDHNVVQQYWTLPAGKEFMAIEYTYDRLKKN